MVGLAAETKSSPDVFEPSPSPCTARSAFSDNSANKIPLNPCPRCGSTKLWRDAKRYTAYGDEIQRWKCRECEHRFSDPNDVKKSWSKQENTARKQLRNEIKMTSDLVSTRQICVGETKNLNAEPQTSEVLRRNEPSTANTIGKIVDYEFWMIKQGYAKSTIETRVKILRRLIKLGATLYDPESIKETVAKQTWSEGRKEIIAETYSNFLVMAGGKWDPPRYKRIEKMPFIPTEQEIDALIAGCGEKSAALLQALKETGMRIGEAWNLKWIDIDTVNSTISITPEKGSHARMFKVSNKLLAMINKIPKKSDKIFGTYELRGYRGSFVGQRKRTARKLQNPRINQITFHTFRHWKATMEYHKTKDILHVMRLLGHKNIKNTLIYTQLVTFQNDDYTCKVAASIKEAAELIEAGYEYVCEMDHQKLFRKRK